MKRRGTKEIVLLAAALSLSAGWFSSVPADAQSQAALPTSSPELAADVAAKTLPVVVDIVSRATLSRGAHRQSRGDSEQAKRLRKYYGINTTPDVDEYQKITGSGVIVRSDGYILTCLHVIENASTINVTLSDQRTLPAKVMGKDPFTDLALIKIAAQDLPVAAFADAAAVRLGEWVLAIGNQYGYEHTVTQGIISGIAREAKGYQKSFGALSGTVRFLQTDAAINPGSSGGPLVDEKGRVVGINTFVNDEAQNMSFAIPSNVAHNVAEQLLSGSGTVHPYIGIVMKEPDPLAAAQPGVEVTDVKFRSPAAAAGIAQGDVIVEVDGVPVAKSDDVSLAVAKRHVGEDVKLKVRRGTGEREIDVRVEKLPDEGD